MTQSIRARHATAVLMVFVLWHSFSTENMPAEGGDTTSNVRTDLVYATVDGAELKLDLHLPAASTRGKPPLIVWVHGGAWRAGSKSDMPLGRLVAEGYAVASVDYRLSTVAPFPAQVHDIKAAIRYLRGHADELGVDASKVVIAGGSAGGHLAALVGVSNGHRDLEGAVGEQKNVSSDVQAVISFYGASNLRTILSQSTPHGLKVRVPALQLLLGGQPEEKPELAKLASPVTHVDRIDPPLLLIHGDKDPQMPIEQSRELADAYRKQKLSVEFEVIEGGAHGGQEFYDEQRMTLVRKFLERSLRR